MQQQSGVRRRRVIGKRATLLGILALIVLAVVFQAGSRFVFAPWSLGVFGRDTLTGDWAGTARARQGAEYGLYLELEYRGRSRNAGSARTMNLQGHAALCTSAGERYDYDVSGRADRSGDIEDLWLEYGNPSLSALDLRFNGSWDPPALSLVSDANPFLPDGRFDPDRVLNSADPDDSLGPFALVEGGRADFDAICERIGP